MANTTHLDHLRELIADRQRIDAEIADLVRVARSISYSWEKIADALGMTRQSAWERYHRQVEE